MKIDTTTVARLDLKRYLGKWYEIARFDHSFERGLEGVTAEYALRPDGKIRVLNSGHKGTPEGPLSTATGKAKIPDPETPGHLRVSFFLWFYSDYNVMELTEDYSCALVGSRTDKYLWILARTPEVPWKLLDGMLVRARERGYDTSNLVWVKQSTTDCHGI